MKVLGLLVSDKKIFKSFAYEKKWPSRRKVKVNPGLSFVLFKLYWAHVPNAAYQATGPLVP